MCKLTHIFSSAFFFSLSHFSMPMCLAVVLRQAPSHEHGESLSMVRNVSPGGVQYGSLIKKRTICTMWQHKGSG